MKLHRPEDTEVENRVAAELRSRFSRGNYKIVMAPPMAVYDLQINYPEDGKVLALVEIKRRNIDSGDHDDIHVSLRKLIECWKAVEDCGAVFLIFVAVLNDGMFATRFAGLDMITGLRTRESGRTDRGFKNDLETMAIIPMDRFQKLV